MTHGIRFVDEYPEYKRLFNQLFLQRELDSWYISSCGKEIAFPKEFTEIPKVKKVITSNHNYPSIHVYIKLEETLGDGEFSLNQEIHLRVSKLIPVYEISYLYTMNHEKLTGNVTLFGSPQTFEMLEVGGIVKAILSEMKYLELHEKYDSPDTVFYWDEVPNLDPTFRSLTIEQAVFEDVLGLCE